MKDNKIRVRALNKGEVVYDYQMPVTSKHLDGFKLTDIHICADLTSQSECDALIKFLQLHKSCFEWKTSNDTI